MGSAADGSTTEQVLTPIDEYLAEQADMSSVDRFSRVEVTGRTGKWTDLIPLSKPSEGEQFRFDVDLDLCTGCKACVTACHSLNGLDESESFRSVGLLVAAETSSEVTTVDATFVDLVSLSVGSSPMPQPVNQVVTTACHHCVDPGCLNGCPAKAYEKDPETGIVKHLDDACIGCEYCTMTCPYDVPVYNKRLGIVRKCDMCSDRLAEGEAPACVQGCPNEAISISIVSKASLGQQPKIMSTDEGRLVPGAAESSLTSPTTLYRRQQPLPETARPVDDNTVEPGHAHTPLAGMLVLSQVAVGLHLARIAGYAELARDQNQLAALLVLAVTAAAIAISALHLGQPLKAWRVLLGFKHSWLSREAVALSAFFGLAAAAFVGTLTDWQVRSLPDGATGIAGVVTVGCSAMVYGVTGRRWWRPTLVIAKFGLTTFAAGSALLLASAGLLGAVPTSLVVGLTLVLVVSTAVKLVLEVSVRAADDPEQRRTAELLARRLANQQNARLTLGVLGGILCPVLAIALGPDGWTAVVLVVGTCSLVAGELLERGLFFKASSSPTMPGSMA